MDFQSLSQETQDRLRLLFTGRHLAEFNSWLCYREKPFTLDEAATDTGIPRRWLKAKLEAYSRLGLLEQPADDSATYKCLEHPFYGLRAVIDDWG